MGNKGYNNDGLNPIFEDFKSGPHQLFNSIDRVLEHPKLCYWGVIDAKVYGTVDVKQNPANWSIQIEIL